MQPAKNTFSELMGARFAAQWRGLLAAATAVPAHTRARRHSEPAGDLVADRCGRRIPDVFLDQSLAGVDPQTVFHPNGVLDELRKEFVVRALIAEMDHQLATRGTRSGQARDGVGSVAAETLFPQSARSRCGLDIL